MNARDIIKLAAQLYVYDALKKKITILTNIQKGKDINVDIFLPKVTDVTVSDFAKHLQKAIESQPEEERAKHRKFFGEPIPKNQTNCFSTIKAINTIYSPATS
jgi:hypothetical protein